MTESRRVAIARCAMAVVLLASATLLAVREGRGQEAGRVYRIALLGIQDSSILTEPWFGAFVQALRDLGWMEAGTSRSSTTEGEGHADRLPALAADLARRKPDVIMTRDTQSTAAAKNATATVPIVMWTTLDPVKQGFVVSMARPGGNVTGLADFTTLSRKQLELTKELLPGARRVAVLRNPAGPQAVYHTSEVEQAARALSLQLQIVDVRSPHELAGALAVATQNRPQVMVMLADFMFLSERGTDRRARTQSPLALDLRETRVRGRRWLLAYGSSRIEVSRRQAAYVDKILKGAKPADLPVEQPTKFELVINMKTAKALGLTIPPSLLLRADQVIE